MHCEIREHIEPGMRRPSVYIDIWGVEAVPLALRRLAEMGHDMTPALKALQAACEEQRKRKALEAAITDLTKKPEQA